MRSNYTQSQRQAAFVTTIFFHRGIWIARAEVNSLLSATLGRSMKTHSNNSVFGRNWGPQTCVLFSYKHSKFPSHAPILRLCPYSTWLFCFPGGNPQLLFVKYLNAVFCFSYLASLKKYWNITFPGSLTSAKLNIPEPRDHMKLPAEMIWNKFKNFLSLNVWPNTITGSFLKKDYLRWRSSDVFLFLATQRNDKKTLRRLLVDFVRSVSLDIQRSRMPGFESKVMKNHVNTQVVSNTMGPRDTGSELLSKPRWIPSHLCSQPRPESTSMPLYGMCLGTRSYISHRFYECQSLSASVFMCSHSVFTVSRSVHCPHCKHSIVVIKQHSQGTYRRKSLLGSCSRTGRAS